MNLRDVAYALRVASDVTRAGERLFDSLADSRRLVGWPLVFGIGIGVGVGALVFNDEARRRAKVWLAKAEAPLIGASQGARPDIQAATPPQ